MRILDKIKDALSSKFAEIVVGVLAAALFGFSTATIANFWALFKVDPVAVSALSASFFTIGLIIGFVARLVVERALPTGRVRKKIERLPKDQRALLGIALGADGVASVPDHGNDIVALSDEGLISIVRPSSGNKFYTTTDVVRKSVSKGMREELRRLGDAMLEADRRERIGLLASGIAKYDIVDRELLAELVSAGSRGVDVHSSYCYASSGEREKGRALESLALQELCDFETISDGKRWFPTDLLLEVAERHPGLFTEL